MFTSLTAEQIPKIHSITVWHDNMLVFAIQSKYINKSGKIIEGKKHGQDFSKFEDTLILSPDE